MLILLIKEKKKRKGLLIMAKHLKNFFLKIKISSLKKNLNNTFIIMKIYINSLYSKALLIKVIYVSTK